MGECEGRVALVTGASRGIGRAIALRLAAEGAAVVVNASRRGAHEGLAGTLDEVVEAIRSAGGRASALPADVTDRDARSDLVARAGEAFGAIDVLVNNAGGGRMQLPSRASARDRSWMYELNLNAPIDLAQQAIPDMRARGAGWILNISSAAARQSPPPYPDSREAALVIGPYGATKAALDRYTEALAHEVAPDGIFVNSMAPVAIVLTSGADHVRDIARRNPSMVEPVEMMAEAAIELCSRPHVGRVVASRAIVHEVGRPVKSLDGRRVLGDAFLAADPEATA